MQSTNQQRKILKAKAHHLKPVIRIGQKGVSESLIAETEVALDHHELIKIHIAGDDRDARKQMAEKVAADTGALLVDQIGKVAVLFRKNKNKEKA